jgi:hypothetical protein
MHLKLWPLAVAAGLGIVDGLTARDPLQRDDADDEGPGLEFETLFDPRPRAALYELVMNAHDDAEYERVYWSLPDQSTDHRAFREICRRAQMEVREGGHQSYFFDELYKWLRGIYAA